MNSTHKGKADMKHPTPPKWKVTVTDKSSGAVLDTSRPSSKPQIGPQSKTNFGKNR